MITMTTTTIMIMAYTAAFPQSGSSSAGISVTGRFPYFFQEVLWVLKVPCIGLVEVGLPTQGGGYVAQTEDETPFGPSWAIRPKLFGGSCIFGLV